MDFYIYFKTLSAKTNQKRAFSLGKFTKSSLFHSPDLMYQRYTQTPVVMLA